MKKPSFLYLFVLILSLAIAAFALLMIYVALGSNAFVLPAIIIIIIVGFFMYIAKQLNTAQFAKRLEVKMECPVCKAEIDINSDFCPKCGVNLKGEVECEYCGHLNPAYLSVCEECHANLK